jgi:hypothetical protein
MVFSKARSAAIFTQLILLVHHYEEIKCVPLPVEVYDVYQEEIKNLRERSWNISHGKPDYAVGKRGNKNNAINFDHHQLFCSPSHFN